MKKKVIIYIILHYIMNIFRIIIEYLGSDRKSKFQMIVSLN